MARRPRSGTQFVVIVAFAGLVYLLLRHPVGTAAGYIATGVGGVLVLLYLPLWIDRARHRVRRHLSRWGWWR